MGTILLAAAWWTQLSLDMFWSIWFLFIKRSFQSIKKYERGSFVSTLHHLLSKRSKFAYWCCSFVNCFVWKIGFSVYSYKSAWNLFVEFRTRKNPTDTCTLNSCVYGGMLILYFHRRNICQIKTISVECDILFYTSPKFVCFLSLQLHSFMRLNHTLFCSFVWVFCIRNNI